MERRTRIGEHIRSNVVGYIALFCFAIGGTAVANHGDPNSITSRDIVNRQVKKPDVAANAITGAKITGGAVTAPKIAAGAVGSTAIADGSIGGADVNDVTRGVNLPIASFVNSSDGEPIDFVQSADNDPDLQAGNFPHIEYDAVPGQVDSDQIGSSLMVPPDYASGGELAFRVTEGIPPGAQTEQIRCFVTVNAGAPSAAATTPLAAQLPSQTVVVTPVAAYAAGDSVGVICDQSNAAADQAVRIHTVEFRYTATQ